MCGIAKLRYALAAAVEMIVPTRDKSPDSRGWAACPGGLLLQVGERGARLQQIATRALYSR